MTQVPLPHELVPEPVLNEHFDRETIRRGRAYAESGQVLQVRTGRESGGVTLSGAVAGTRLSPYDVEVYVAQDRGRMTLYTDCTCPVEIECKHAVALVLAANAANAANAASGETGAGGGNASSVPAEGTDGSGWAFLLDRSLSELEQHAPAAGDAIPLGLLFEHKLTQYRWQRAPVRSLQIRPVQRGRREAWVKTGAGWSEVMYSLPARRQHDPGQLVALAEMVPAFGAYAHNPDLLQVGPLLWPLLRRAVDAGIELVPGAGLTAVELADDPLELEADLTSPGQAIDVRLGVRYGAASSEHLEHAWWPGEDRDLVFLGRTGHGVALLRSVTPPGRRRTPHSELVLARLARPVPEGVQMLVGSGQGVVVPDVGRDRFLDEFVPRLRRQLPIGSGDGSVEIPDEVPPRLVLEIRWQAPHEIETSWWWRYGDGDGHRLPIDSSIDSSSGRPATAGKGLATVTGIGGPVGGPTRGPSSGPMSSAMSSPMSSAVENEGLATLRNPMAERAVLAELDLAGRTGIEVDGQGRPVAQQTWGGRELLVFVNRVLPVLRDSGLVDVEEIGEQPDYREAETDPLVFFELAEAAGDREGTADAVTDWLDLTVRITVDGEDVPLAMVLACLTLGSELVFTPSGRHLPADHPAFAKLAELVAAAGQLVEQPSDGVRVGRRDLSLWAELADTGVVDAQAAQWVEAAQKLRDLERLPEVTPSGLKSELRPYQRSGLQWLAFLWKAQLGGILADDMGLGKTLQALALVGHARESGAAPFLVVAPTSVVSAWAHEAAAHVPGLAVRTVTASAARREKSIADLYAEADLVVTTYTLLRLEADAYAEQAWGWLILDEAQQIKNHQGRTYQAVRRLDVPFRLALTGTPFENRLMELWSLLSVTAPGLYPWPARFK